MRTFILPTCLVLLVATSALRADDGDIKTRSKANSDEAAAAMKLADKGVDEDGDKVWKQEAREFFDFKKNPKNRTFEMPVAWARKFIDGAYAAGAEKVWVVGITETELAGHKFHISDEIVVVLPNDPARRKAVFDAYHKALGEDADEEQKLVDVGQAYLYVQAD
jgi:hypothetical protein